MLHVLVGEDDFSILQALEEIKRGIGDATALMSSTTVLDGRKVTVEELRNACETMPFLAEKRLVIVEGLLERFEPANRNAGKKTSRQKDKSENYNLLVEAMKQLPDFTELVIIGGGVKASNPLFRELSSLTRLRAFPHMKGRELGQWIERRVKESGGTISPQALSMLLRFVGNDLWAVAGEVDKLVLYAGERRIEEDDIKALVSYAQEASVFAMVDAVLEARVTTAQKTLQQLFRQGIAPAQLLVMISRQVRIILQIKEMHGRGKSRGEIQNRLGLSSDFLLRKAWEQADRYSPARLRELYRKLLECDLAIKTGKLDGELALDVLVAELGQAGTVAR